MYRRGMPWLRYVVSALALVGCVDEMPRDDMAVATTDGTANTTDGPAGATWDAALTLHADSPLAGFAAAGSRRVHSLWVAGSNGNRVPLTISARALGDGDVRIALLGPLTDGTRAVLGAAGYTSHERAVSLAVDIAQPGEHVVVVGSYGLATDVSYELTAACTSPECGVSRVDALATPKDGALVGNSDGLVSALLGDALVGYGDVEVELWASPPLRPAQAQLVATSEASGTQVNALVDSSVHAGDDLRLVVREAGGGRVLDTGVAARYAPAPAPFARLDSVVYSDLGGVQIAGVVGYFEGVADMELHSETRHMRIAESVQHATRPGQVGNGFGAFDATFGPGASDGELLSIGVVNANAEYQRLGCFEYCNNLSGLSGCSGGMRPCPQ